MTQMLAPGGGAFPEPYYTLVIINMLAQEAAASSERREGAGGGGQEGDGLATRTIGIAARVLWKFLFALDDAALPALATWVSHHAASTRWDWLWEEWAPALTSDTTPPHDPQRRLMAALLQRTFALVGPWHHDAVVAKKFPAALVEGGFIPPKHGQAAASVFFPAPLAAAAAPAPTERGVAGGGSSASEMDAGAGGAGASGGSSGANAGAGVDAGAAAAHEAADAAAIDAFVRRCARESPGLYPDLTADAMPALRAFAGGVMGQLKSKLEAPALATWLRAAASSEGGGAAAGLSHATVLLVLAHALLIYAKANMRNTRIILERYHALLADPAIAGLSLAPPAAVASSAAGGAAAAAEGAAEANRVSVLLDALHGVWGRHRYIGNAAIVDLVDIGALSAQQVARYELKLTALAEPPAAPQQRQAGASSAEAPAAFATPSGGSVSAAAAVALLSERALALDTWETIAAALAWARDAAHRGGVELSLFLGARVFDVKEEELDADVAEGREGVLRAAAATSAAAYEATVVGAAQACADLCRVLQARLDAANAAAGAGGSASGGGGAAGSAALGPQQMRALRETLRVALAHSRALFLQHVPAVAGASAAGPGSAAAAAALQAVVAQGAHLEPDLVGAALAAALRPAADARLVVPEALLRDADVPAPTLV
jgi:hypothetical protein